MKMYLSAAFSLLLGALSLSVSTGCRDKASNCTVLCKYSVFARTNCMETCGHCPDGTKNSTHEKIPNLPLKFITVKNIIRAADETDKFSIQLCGGCLYDGHTARIALNMQSGSWDTDSGNSLDVYVYSQNGRRIGTNLVNSNPVQDFDFIYKADYGDLVIVAKTGKHTTFTYTVTVQFSSNKTASTVTSSCLPRLKMNAGEINKQKNVTSFTNSLGYKRGHLLKPVYRREMKSVNSAEKEKRIQLHYCFPEMPSYNLTVSTVSLYNITIATIGLYNLTVTAAGGHTSPTVSTVGPYNRIVSTADPSNAKDSNSGSLSMFALRESGLLILGIGYLMIHQVVQQILFPFV